MPDFSSKDLAKWCGGHWTGQAPKSLNGVSIDTRTLQPGNLYIAIRGDRHEGHDFVGDAFQKGAAAALISEFCAPKWAGKGPLLTVKDTRKALLDIAAGHRQARELDIVAITGSVGKTTVKEMIADALGTLGPTVRTRGNWNNDIGMPMSMLDIQATDRFGVFEVGMNHPGELAPLCAVLQPSCGVITAIGPVHLEFFDSVQSIAREKATVLASLPADGLAVLCRDERWYDLLRSHAKCPVLTTSLKGDADYVGKPLSDDEGKFVVYEKSSGERIRFETPLPGDYVVHDALLAIAVARSRGARWDALQGTIRGYKPLALRWNLQSYDGIDFVVDAYNANPVSMRAALQAFGQMRTKGGKWLVLAAMRELGAADREEHLSLGAEVATGAWAGLVVVGEHGATIAEGAELAGWPAKKSVRCPDIVTAARALKEKVEPGDAVLLKASRGEHLEDVLTEWKKLRGNPRTYCSAGRGDSYGRQGADAGGVS